MLEAFHKRSSLQLITYSCLSLLLSACATQTPSQIDSIFSPQIIDLSGHWEKNYQLSDDINSKFQLFIYDIQRPYTNSNASVQGVPRTGISNESLIGLLQITEDITKVTLLEIEQDQNSIQINREDNFALTCDYFERAFVNSNTPFGSESCGWNGQQLLFQMKLNDGLGIFHQITLGPDGQQLNITTTVSSSVVSNPFTVSSYYQRYSPPEYNYDCIFTLSRNNVCTQNGS